MFGCGPHCLDLTGGETVGFFSVDGVESPFRDRAAAMR
jgi:hypothetical protein